MNSFYLQQIPERIRQEAIFTIFCIFSKTNNSIFALTKQKIFFEISKCIVLSKLNLGQTILKDVALPNYKSIFGANILMNSLDSDNKEKTILNENANFFNFGKYFRYDLNGKSIFLLLQIYDKLIILEKKCQKLDVIKEYENVSNFEIVDTEKNYTAKVAIFLHNENNPIITDFRDDIKDTDSTNFEIIENSIFQSLIENIDKCKIELKMHKMLTAQQLLKVKNEYTFGPNLIRSDLIEEKQPLQKYGDIWIKIHNNYLVIGLPLINNCCKRLTTLQNIRPIIFCAQKQSIEFEYQLFCLKDDSYSFDNIIDLLDKQNAISFEKKTHLEKDWHLVKKNLMLPGTAAVMVLKTNLDIFQDYNEYYLDCFLLFDIQSNDETFTLQEFIQSIKIDPEIIIKQEYQILFNDEEIFKDILAVRIASFNFQLKLSYSQPNLSINNFLINQLGFDYFEKKENNTLMDIETENEEVNISTGRKIYYHKRNPFSFWFGTLIKSYKPNSSIEILNISSRTKEIIGIFVQTFYKKFPEDCIITPLPSSMKIAEMLNLEDELRKELNMVSNFCFENKDNQNLTRSEVFDFQKELFKQELNTDIAYSETS